MKNKKGISLIVLVITIIVMLILASTVIISLSNNGIILKSNEAVFKTNVKSYMEELDVYIGHMLSKNTKYNMSKLNADTTTSPSIQDVIESIKDEDVNEFIIKNGNLVYIGEDEEKIKWCDELGIKTKTQKEPLTEAEYNELYKDEIANALKYGKVENNVYKIKDEYNMQNPNASATAKIPVEDSVLAMPYGVTTIARGTFISQSNVTNVIFPSTLTVLEGGVFLGASGLKEIDLTYIESNIEDYTFQGCTNLVSIKMPKKEITIGSCVFSGCSSLEAIDLSNVTFMGTNSFENCTNLKKVKLSNNMKSLGFSLFVGCDSLESLVLPSSVNEIYTFSTGKNFKSLYIEGENINVYPMGDDYTSSFENLKSTTTIYVRSKDVADYLTGKVGEATISTEYDWVAPEY